jgi:hypothetical protein
MTGAPTARTAANTLVAPAMIWNAGVGAYQLVSRVCVETTSLANLVANLAVTAHNITIFPVLPSLFYNAYMPIRYAENSLVVSPVDTGSFLVTFCLYPGKFNPSGYYNLSAGRELYVNSNLISDPDDVGGVEMTVSGSALNLLIARGDVLSLKFTL